MPSGFQAVHLSGDNENENRYIYPDSSIIYITDFNCSILNFENIKSVGDSLANERLMGLHLKSAISKVINEDFHYDIIKLEGISSNELYWKDKRIEYISIGYVNVSSDEKSRFDDALESLKRM